MVKLGEVMNRAKSEFDQSLIRNADIHSSYPAPNFDPSLILNADIHSSYPAPDFDQSLILNADIHSSYPAPPGWDVLPRVQEYEGKMISNALTSNQNTPSTVTEETIRTPVEDTDVSASPISPAPLCRQFWKAGSYEDVLASRSQIQNSKNCLHIHPKFLHSNATSHKWAFGAIAELVDNAVDEIQNGASCVIVDKISNPRDASPALLVQDDGGGMDPENIRRCMSFGFSEKKSESAIGRYGNGFKTSTMRLGADVIVFSRHLNDRTFTQSVGLLSYTYLSRMGLDRIVVPMVDYKYNISTKTFHPLYRFGEQHFQSNLLIILQWSPYQTEAVLMKEFEDIGAHGTRVIIFNLWFSDDGKLELDFETDTKDICLQKCNDLKKVNSKMLSSEEHIGNQYRYSLRVYLSILYLRIPKHFFIFLRGKVVEHHVIAQNLKYPEFILYKPQTGGSKEEILTTIGFLKEAPHVSVHGFNVYHKNRLILPFWQVVSYGGNKGRGVVGILEANFIEPTHNKQDFERTSLFQKLETRLKEMTSEYWDYHCGLIGYQVPKKASSHPRPSNMVKDSEVSSSIVDKATPVSFVVNLPARDLVTAKSSIQQQSGKRTYDALISSLGSGKEQNRVEPKVPQRDGLTMGIQPVIHPAMSQNQQDTMNMLQQEHKKLREKCLEYEKSEEELEFKVSWLRHGIKEAQQEYERMLIERQKLEGCQG